MLPEKVLFYKYQGAGNDFILIDNRENIVRHTDISLFKKLCDRRFGIGADGLMLLENDPELDFNMFYANADGNKGSMCGNGGRCIVAFAKKLGIITDDAVFSATDGMHAARISGSTVSLQMIDVSSITATDTYWLADTGSPHYIRLVTGLEEFDVPAEGKAIRNSDMFRKEGINVNFVEQEGDHYFVRTFERGVEDETLACGTGVTAVAIAMAHHRKATGQQHTEIRTRGGVLRVSFCKNEDGSYTAVCLEGPAEYVFEGHVLI